MILQTAFAFFANNGFSYLHFSIIASYICTSEAD